MVTVVETSRVFETGHRDHHDGFQPMDLQSGGGEMGARIRAADWSKTPIGPIQGWSPSLRTMVSFMLVNRFPLLLWWGPDYISIYNDAYRPVLGAKHPWALGTPVRECWSEIWDVLKPLIDAPFQGGPATWSDDLRLEINRYGFVEETHFTVAYSPVPDEDAPRGIGGVLATVHEITDKIIGERRITALRDLAASSGEAGTAEEACATAMAALSSHPKDVPFAVAYLIDESRKVARLASATGVDPGEPVAPVTLPLDGPDSDRLWPALEVLQRESTVTVANLAQRFSKIPPGPWSDPPHTAVVAPIKSNVAHRLAGFLIAGVSARARLDEQYGSFFDLVASQITSAIATARAYEEERKRGQALAELDRAKTLFFSNVSHEFRTPLTLMLGPLEDTLASASLPASERERLDVAHRNSLRLLKLVNSLLDFSRIEAGRTRASYELVDLPAFTAELASNFQSICERAGLQLIVDCQPLPEPTYVDRDMWEKIVLNLLSNAFKFTFEGRITVSLSAIDGSARLLVRDTGVGIPRQELPRLFERFHRIEGQRSRTYEGSGIGLALVQELVRSHRGTIRAESKPNSGTTFIVDIPLGTAHLPANRSEGERNLVSTSVRAEAYVQEALGWLPGAAPSTLAAQEIDAPRGMLGLGEREHVLVAEDNADMRAYVRHVLGPHCEIETVDDGEAALESIRTHRPDLLISDVMMPRLDGFGLLRAIRSDPALRDLSVIMLSARAGEESRVEGLEAGADDYLIKPFSARELIARVSTNLKLDRVRREKTEVLRRSRDQTEALNKELQAKTRFLEVLNHISRTISADLDLDRIVQTVTDSATAVIGAKFGAFFYNLVDDQGERYAPYKLSGAPLEAFEKFCMPRNTAVFEDTFRGTGVIRSDNIRADPRYGRSAPHNGMPKGHLPVVSYLAVPVVSRSGEVHGGLFFGHDQPGVFTQDAEDAISAIASHAAIAIDNAHLFEAAQKEIVQRRNAEEILRDREQRLSAIFAQATVGFAETDVSGRFIMLNDRYCEIAGHSRTELLQRGIQDILHNDDLVVHAPLFERAVTKGQPYDIEQRYVRSDRSLVWVNSSVFTLRGPSGEVERITAICVDITERKRHDESQKLLLNELNHRVKNTLAIVQSIAIQTLRNSEDALQARELIGARLVALSQAHDVLTREHWEGALLGQIVNEAVAPHNRVRSERFKIEGPPTWLPPKHALALALALHELCTNAAKYGALSNERGRVRISWTTENREDAQDLQIQWIELDGPPVELPSRHGFGSRLIERGLRHDLGAEVRIDYAPSGVICTIKAPLTVKTRDSFREATAE
jgi:PAS domain S-box-containing protein